MSKGWTAPSMAADLIKALRPEPRTMADLREDLGWGELTLHNWLRELCANGIVERDIDSRAAGKQGKPPFVYWLRRDWGGQA